MNYKDYAAKIIQHPAIIIIASIYNALGMILCALMHWCFCGHLKHDQSNVHIVSDILWMGCFIFIIMTSRHFPHKQKVKILVLLVISEFPPVFMLLLFNTPLSRMMKNEGIPLLIGTLFSFIATIWLVVILSKNAKKNIEQRILNNE